MDFKSFYNKKFGGSATTDTHTTSDSDYPNDLKRYKPIIKALQSKGFVWIPNAGGAGNCGIFTKTDASGKEIIVKCTINNNEANDVQKTVDLGLFVPRVYSIEKHNINEQEFTLIFLQKISFDLKNFFSIIPKEIFKHHREKIIESLQTSDETLLQALEELFNLLTLSLSSDIMITFDRLLFIIRSVGRMSKEELNFQRIRLIKWMDNLIKINILLDSLSSHLHLLRELLLDYMRNLRAIFLIIKNQLRYIYALLAKKNLCFTDDNAGNFGIDLVTEDEGKNYLDKNWGDYKFFGKYINVYLLDQGCIGELKDVYYDKLLYFFSNPYILSTIDYLFNKDEPISICGISLVDNLDKQINSLHKLVQSLEQKQEFEFLREIIGNLDILKLIKAKLEPQLLDLQLMNDDSIIGKILHDEII